jgi:PhnB protein
MNTGAPQQEQFEVAIAPWLSVGRGAEAVDYYKAAFGAIEVHRHMNEAGEIVAQLAIGRAEFWVADDPSFSPETLGGGSVRMILSVEDPDRMFDQAIAAGATVIAAMYEGHGWRLGRLADPFGHHWEIGRPLSL